MRRVHYLGFIALFVLALLLQSCNGTALAEVGQPIALATLAIGGMWWYGTRRWDDNK